MTPRTPTPTIRRSRDCGRRRVRRTCLIVLIDDVGFGAASAFGGPCNTPIAERLAANGLKLNRFHTTALCSPTRQAMLTGRNHHSVGMGGITEIATSAPGYSSVRPKDKAPIAETLRLNGYSTSQFGKCHEVPVWEVSPGRTVRAVADGLGLRALLRLHRRRGQPVLPGPLRRHHARRAGEDAGGGLHAHRGSGRPRDHLGAPAEGADARQAVLHVLRARRHARAPPCPEGMVGQVPGQVRRWLGRAARADLRPSRRSWASFPQTPN